MSDAEKTLVTVATYNEIENLPKLVEEIFAYAPEVDLLVIDDNSPDGTGPGATAGRRKTPGFACLHRPAKLGLGTAIIAGMKYALEHGYRQVLNMDADFSHHPRYLPAILAGMDPPEGPPVDVMIGSRYIPGGGIEGWPWRRHFMSRGVNLYSRWLLGLKCKDCSGAFRCYRTSLLARLDFDRDPLPRLFLPGRDPLASPAAGRPLRRDADRLRRPPRGLLQDQQPGGVGRLVDHPRIGAAESTEMVERCKEPSPRFVGW